MVDVIMAMTSIATIFNNYKKNYSNSDCNIINNELCRGDIFTIMCKGSIQTMINANNKNTSSNNNNSKLRWIKALFLRIAPEAVSAASIP